MSLPPHGDRDLSLAGQPIRAGDRIFVYHVPAHYDEREFADPFRFDPARSPNRHLAFGHPQVPRRALRAPEDVPVLHRRSRPPAAGRARRPVQRLTSNFINGINQLPPRWGQASARPSPRR
jgi:hypothetical protein